MGMSPEDEEMMSTEHESGDTPKFTDAKVAAMTADRRLIWMRILRRQQVMTAKEGRSEIAALKAEFDAALSNPVDTKVPADAVRRLQKMQELDAKIDNSKAVTREKVTKLQGAFDALLFPKRKPTTQTDLFPADAPTEPPVAPEVLEVMKGAVAGAMAEAKRVAAEPATTGDDEKDPAEDVVETESFEDLEALQAELSAMVERYGAANVAVLDEATEAGEDVDPPSGGDVIKMPPPKGGKRGRGRKPKGEVH